MANFFAELKRRHIYRVAAAYAVVAWVLLQLFNNLQPIMKLPDWAGTLVLVLLIGGFPIALFFAWMRELGPADGTAAPATTRLDYVLAGALIVVIGLVSYQQLASSPGVQSAQKRADVATSAAGISIAVLPFANLSGDVSQEFFSDGMTEEITAALAKVQGLTVLARTSAFEFKGQNRSIRDIAQALNARYVIEGSVRKEGDQVRITAQLVQGDNGANVWSESYDRQLTSVFATQEDIARAIAGALRVPLGLQQGETLVSNRTTDLDSYEAFLRARVLYRARTTEAAIEILEPLVVRNPTFAPAWGLLAETYVIAVGDRTEKAAKAAREAIRLDPQNAAAYGALADVDSQAGRWADGEDGFRRALAIDPNEPDVLHRYSTRLGVAGRIKDALAQRQKLNTLEPFVPLYNVNTARFLVSSGQSKAAIAILEKIPGEGFDLRNVALARAYAAEGRYAEASNAVLALVVRDATDRRTIEVAARLLESASAKTRPETLPAQLGSQREIVLRNLNFVYAYVGALDPVMEGAERGVEEHFFGAFMDTLWQREAAPLRKTERFKKFVRDSGLFDYWRTHGWADACRPVGADDFVCD